MYRIRDLSARQLLQESFDEAGFHPAFLDTATFSIHLSRYADGRPAPFHLFDGLPDDLVAARSMFGRAVAVKETLVTGFERNGFFYTPSAAARAVVEWDLRGDARA